ncbi:helix-turn-helix transcriptional regulator [Roseibium aggregatum]|uniref:Helix-turn-helix domain-containing protein n=1 Tax=Roseibium aggregatum TaxID=187304 RepID=A0A939EFQ4_9HYPH|nr:helix-turn-helix transcriptional regulator [Roseibium aggregatum]MBN9672049.1 helix-turn-helix domain-containing protein [Roseibium aggregatum]
MPRIPTRRSTPAVLRISSPLTRGGYTLAAGNAHLVLTFAGRLEFQPPKGARRSLADGPRILWFADGDGGELVADAGTRALMVSLPQLVLTGALPATPLGEQIARTLRQELTLPFEETNRIREIIEGLEAEQRGGLAGADVAALHYVSLLLLYVWRLARVDLVTHGRAPQGLAERFVLLAGQHLREHIKVEDYARSLGVSRDRLGTAVRRATGFSPQGYLHQLLMREAAELLANTGMPVGQVAFRLGFSDPPYFTRFFNRMSGVSPAQFRKRAKARRAAGDDSYAAWP